MSVKTLPADTGAATRRRFAVPPTRDAPVLRYGIALVLLIGGLVIGSASELDQNARHSEWRQSITNLASASRVAGSDFQAVRADLRARAGQLAASLAIQRAVIAHDDQALARLAHAEHAQISSGGKSFGRLRPKPRVDSTAQITNAGRVLARVTLSVPLGHNLLVLLRHATPLSRDDSLVLSFRGRVVAGGPAGAPARIRADRIEFGKTSFAAAGAPLSVKGASVLAIQPVSAINALSLPYRRFLFLAAAITLAVAAGAATRLGRPLARLVGEVTHLRRQVQTDPLTGLASRAALSERLHAELVRAVQYGTSVSLVLADVDNFKYINDTYGHQAGDEILRAFGRTMVESCRDLDLAARLGGDEFALVLPGSRLLDARRVAERTRRALDSLTTISPDGQEMRVTASLGAAEFPTYGDVDALVAAADAALYEAKQGGKNRIATATASDRRKRKTRSSVGGSELAGNPGLLS